MRVVWRGYAVYRLSRPKMGVPSPDGTPQFEMLILEGQHAGLIWLTICHALMQAIGKVNDHLRECHRHATVRVL